MRRAEEGYRQRELVGRSLPTEREPRTAILRLLRSAGGDIGDGDGDDEEDEDGSVGGGGGYDKRVKKEKGGIVRRKASVEEEAEWKIYKYAGNERRDPIQGRHHHVASSSSPAPAHKTRSDSELSLHTAASHSAPRRPIAIRTHTHA